MKSNRLLTASILSAIMLLITAACNSTKNPDESKVLSETDRAYSAISAERGMNAAFLAMFDSAGVLLRSNHAPIKGYEAIRELFNSENDTTFILTWEPAYAKIAASGDLGYTYGTYQITDKATDSISGEGTYSTIWQKQADGKWKAVLDTGNPGLGMEK
jgi:ketosteroid isomerase-like protein